MKQPIDDSRHRRRSFSLVELLVVVAILAILVSLLSPSLNRALMNARMTVCKQMLKAIAQAANVYGEDYNDQLPIGKVINSDSVSQLGYSSGRYDTLGAGYTSYPYQEEPQAGIHPYAYTNNKRLLSPVIGLTPYLGRLESWLCPDSEAAEWTPSASESNTIDDEEWDQLSKAYYEGEAIAAVGDDPRPTLNATNRRQILGYYWVPPYAEDRAEGSHYEFKTPGSHWRYNTRYPGATTLNETPERVLSVDMTLAWRGEKYNGNRNRHYFYDIPHSMTGWQEGMSNLVRLDGSVYSVEVYSGMEPFRRTKEYSENIGFEGMISNVIAAGARYDEASMPFQPSDYNLDESTVVPMYYGNLEDLVTRD